MSQDEYQRVAGWYDRVFGPLTIGLRGLGMKMHPPNDGARVLDIGCGTGMHLELYQKAGCKVYGIDPSASMIDVARQRLGDEADLRLADASNLPFDDGYFDLIVCMLVLHEIPPITRSAIVNEAKRTLNSAGRILLVDYHSGSVRGLRGWWSKFVITLSEVAIGGEHFQNYRQFMAHAGLAPLVEEGKFAVDKQRVVAGGNFELLLLSHS